MIQKFNDLPWHDAELKGIIIEREQKENVRILVRWPNYFGEQDVFIGFTDCYAFQSDMHFGIMPPEFILEAKCISESQELDNIKKIWAKMGLDLSELHCYRIITNPTNSTINIFALSFQIINIKS